MNTLKKYVDWKLAHSDKIADAEGYPLVLEKCKKNKKMKDFKILGADGGVGNLSRNLFDNSNIRRVSCWKLKPNTLSSTSTGVTIMAEDDITPTDFPSVALSLGLASDFAGKTITFSSPSISGSVDTKLRVNRGVSSVQNGTNWTQKGDIYYSTITVEDKEYTTETLCIVLYGRGLNPGDSMTFENIMVNEGSEPLPYEQHNKYIISIVQDSLDIKNNVLTDGAFSNKINCIYENGVYTFTRTEAFPNRFGEYFNVNIPKGSNLYCRCDMLESTCSKTLMMHVTYADGTTTYLTVYPYSNSTYVTAANDITRLRIYLDSSEAVGSFVKFKHLSLCVDERPTLTKQTHNVFVDEPLSVNDVLDVKEHMELPKLTAKTTVFTLDSTIEPSNMIAKYIK